MSNNFNEERVIPDDSNYDYRDTLSALADKYRAEALERGNYTVCIKCKKPIIGDTYCFASYKEPYCYKCYTIEGRTNVDENTNTNTD